MGKMPLHYDNLAAAYACNRNTHPGVLARLVENGPIGADTRVLEVGCGTANYIAALCEATGCQASGIDPSAEMLAVARGRGLPIDLCQGRAEALPFPDGSFDLLFSVDVIHHISDRPAFFREAGRLLRPGGRLCTVTDPAEDIRRRRPLSSHFPETVAVELNRYPAIDRLCSEMAGAGFPAIWSEAAELPYSLADIRGYRERAYSSLHLIPDGAFERGLARLEAELADGPIPALSLYTLLWGELQ